MKKPLYTLFAAILLVCAASAGAWLLARRNKAPLPREKAASATAPTLEEWETAYPNMIRAFVIETPETRLPPHLNHPGIVRKGTFPVPEPMWIIGSRLEVLNAPNDVFHHLDMGNSAVRSPLCPHGAPFGNLILAMGQESHGGFLPVGYGHSFTQNDVTSAVMFHNQHPESYPKAVVRLTLWYIPRAPVSLKALWPLFLSSDGACEGGSYSVSPRGVVEKHMPTDYIFRNPGTIVFMGAHLHAFGEYFTLFINGRARHTFVPVYTNDGSLESIPFSYPSGLSVRPGDRMNFISRYHNTSDRPIEAMSKALLFIHSPEKE